MMKSVTIKDVIHGHMLLKVKRTKTGCEVVSHPKINSGLIVVVTLEDNSKVTMPVGEP